MKINKISYCNAEENEQFNIERWLNHVVEKTILEELQCSDHVRILLKTSKFMDEQ